MNHLPHLRGPDELSQIACLLWGAHVPRWFNPASDTCPRLRAVNFSSIYLASIETRGVIRILNPAERNKFHVLYIVQKGRVEIELAGGVHTCDPRSLGVIPAHDNVAIRMEEASEVSCVAIPAPVLEAALSALIERRIFRRLHFVPLISRSKPGVGALLRLVEFLIRECDHTDAVPTTAPLAAHQLEKTFLSHLLETLPHNYSDDFVAGPGPVVPWYVRYCEEHIKENLDEPLSMIEMASAVKTSVRTIHEGFRRHRGYSPMGFRRKLRLERVRARLLDPANSKTVTEVAMAFCFWHLGRFSKAYLSAFGELPSETLLRAKNIRIEDESKHVKLLIPLGGPSLAAMNAPLQRFAKAGA